MCQELAGRLPTGCGGLLVQLVVGAATIGVAFRVGTGNAKVNEQVGTRNAEEAAKARISGRSPRGGRSAGGDSVQLRALTVTGSENPTDAHRLGSLRAAQLRPGDRRPCAVGRVDQPDDPVGAGTISRRGGHWRIEPSVDALQKELR